MLEDIKYAVSRWLFRHGFNFGTKVYKEWTEKSLQVCNRFVNARQFYIV